MKQRDRLLVTQTPDATFQIDTDETVVLETPKPLKRKLKKPLHIGAAPTLHLKNASHIYIALVAVLFLLCVIFRGNANKGEVHKLRTEINTLREENTFLTKRMDSMHLEPSNIACIHKGCTINYLLSSVPYTYGFLRRNYTDPHVVLSGDIECFAFRGNKGKIVLEFSDMKSIVGVGVFHRLTEDLTSAPKEIAVYVDEKETTSFQFDPKDIFHKVEFDEEQGKTIVFDIRSNHGKRKFTCIYQLFVYGW
eukprot:jgi/Antlo1/2320/2190